MAIYDYKVSEKEMVTHQRIHTVTVCTCSMNFYRPLTLFHTIPYFY